MNTLRALLFFTLSYTILALQPDRLPNSNNKRFIANKNFPYLDLKSVESEEAALVSNLWKRNLGRYNDISAIDILDQIMELDDFLNMNTDPRYVHLIWVPEGNKLHEILFMIVIFVTHEPRVIKVNQLIPSPLWESSQIESTELKYALEDLALQSNHIIDFNLLYENNVRYKLDWETL